MWRFAAPAHHHFSTIPHGGPALEAIWSPYFCDVLNSRHVSITTGSGGARSASRKIVQTSISRDALVPQITICPSPSRLSPKASQAS